MHNNKVKRINSLNYIFLPLKEWLMLFFFTLWTLKSQNFLLHPKSVLMVLLHSVSQPQGCVPVPGLEALLPGLEALLPGLEIIFKTSNCTKCIIN